MENYSSVYFETTITNDYSNWNRIKKIDSTGIYQIYFHPIKISENLIQKMKEISKPSTNAGDDGPGTLVPKLNQMTYTVSLQGKLRTQTTTIGGVEKTITATDAKNYLKDMFIVLENTNLHWSGFPTTVETVVAKSLQFDSDSNNAHENDLPKEVSFNAIFVVGENII